MSNDKTTQSGPKPDRVATLERPRPLETAPARPYVSPAVLSHSGQDILEELGPAQACYPFNSCGMTP